MTDFVVETNNLLSKALKAIIVLPNSIFENNDLVFSENRKRSAEGLSDKENNLLTIASTRNQSEQNLSFEKGVFINLKTELKAIQKKYNASLAKSQGEASLKFNTENAEVIKSYNDQLAIIQRLKENKGAEEEIKKADAILKKIIVPIFEFNFRSELNWEDIYRYLSTESFSWFLKQFSDAKDNNFKNIDYKKFAISIVADDELNIDGNSIFFNQDSYNEIFEIIDNKTQQLEQDFLNKVTLQQDEFVNIGGVLIPVTKNNNQVVHLSYVLKAIKPNSVFLENTNLGYASLQIQVENESWSISHALINAQTNLGTVVENISNINVVDGQINFAQFLTNQFQTINSLSIKIFFNNGQETILDLNDIINNTELTGILILKSATESSNKNRKGDSPTNTEKHFGLKRLGVAEYLKVVQTVHAYVPGEVSNIENVMASELRHKSINELTRTEDTIATSKTQEVERISDTNKVNRAEMQTEAATEITNQQSFNAHANFSKDAVWKIDIGTSFASNNAQTVSNSQAVTKSQEITERAMERVQSKISEERISKIIHEVSLTNVHEFDNRGGKLGIPQHITGVYRWVDKKMKNQIYNYGKRTMFEFMIPEPAKLHRLAIATQGQVLTPPVDPRKAPTPHGMIDAKSATKAMLEYWAAIYKVTLTDLPAKNIQHVIDRFYTNLGGDGGQRVLMLYIPQNYALKTVRINYGWQFGNLYFSNFRGGELNVGNIGRGSWDSNLTIYGLNIVGSYGFTYRGWSVDSCNFSFVMDCELSDAFMLKWTTENYDAIIKAYDEEYAKYQEKQDKIDAEQKAKEGEQKETQVNFYRIIESDLLKHNCIAYLLQDYLSPATIGQQFTDGDKMENFQVYLNDNLDQYTAIAKFLEQAFEWSIKDYTFYPYYWADRFQWKKMYLSQSVDPLFRSFLQAGMARVIVTVKPGFEDAVQYFMTTGQVWFGGETPVIGDPLYMSIAQEMREPTGIPQGNYWITRIPTTLTILQSGSTGLPTLNDQPLPIFPEKNPLDCENPSELEKKTEFKLDNVQMVGSEKETTLYPKG